MELFWKGNPHLTAALHKTDLHIGGNFGRRNPVFTQINGQSSMAEGCKVQSSGYTVLYWLFVHSVCSHDLVNIFVFISILVLCISMSTVYIYVICPSFSNKFAPKCSQLHNMFSSTSCEWVVWLWMKWGIHAYFIIL